MLPLERIRVVDLSRLAPGPFATLLLRRLGAEVIKIEEPGTGDPARLTGAVFDLLNAGKKSVTLNLKNEAARAVLLDLVRGADVFVESFRPGVMERLGLGYERLRSVNPRLVYCAVTGYGQTGDLRSAPGHDLNYMGRSGILEATGRAGGPPVVPALPVADFAGGGLMAVLGILCALRTRERSGRGEFVDVSMLDGLLALGLIPAAFAIGQPMPPRGTLPLTGGLACYDVYETKDGRYITLAALEPKFWMEFCAAIGRPDLVDAHLNPDEQPRLRTELTDFFKSHSQAEIFARASPTALPIGPVLSVEEAIGERGPVSFPVKFSEARTLEPEPVPALGEHTAGVLQSLGYSVDDLAQQGAI